jgi:hypothetical protein
MILRKYLSKAFKFRTRKNDNQMIKLGACEKDEKENIKPWISIAGLFIEVFHVLEFFQRQPGDDK